MYVAKIMCIKSPEVTTFNVFFYIQWIYDDRGRMSNNSLDHSGGYKKYNRPRFVLFLYFLPSPAWAVQQTLLHYCGLFHLYKIFHIRNKPLCHNRIYIYTPKTIRSPDFVTPGWCRLVDNLYISGRLRKYH